MSSGMGVVVPADWTKAVIVPVYKGKGRRGGECGSYRAISLCSIPGKVIILPLCLASIRKREKNGNRSTLHLER